MRLMRAGMIQTFLETNDSLTFGSSTAANNQRRLEVISTADQDRDGNGKKNGWNKKKPCKAWKCNCITPETITHSLTASKNRDWIGVD